MTVTKVSRADVGDTEAGRPRTWTFLDFEASDWTGHLFTGGNYPGSLYRFAERRGGPGRRRPRQSSTALIADAKTMTTMTTAMITARLLV